MAARSGPVLVVGAGIGGLAAAAILAARGREVVVLERAARPGGKVREVEVGGAAVGAGPATLTMRPVFEEVFRAAGEELGALVATRRQAILGRHAWVDGARLDLPAEAGAATEAIGRFAGAAAARGYQAFRERARRVHDTLEAPFLRAQRPGMLALAAAGLRGALGGSPFASLWEALGEFFPDPRLRQVFSRVATYVGSSPLQAPATLMLVAHVETSGIWAVEGGMMRLIEALEAVARARGAVFRYGAEVSGIILRGGRAAGVRLRDGEAVEGFAVVLNADAAALGAGLFGVAGAVDRLAPERRSFSAITWATRARVEGVPAMQTVVHAGDPTAEYAEIGYRGRLPAVPSVTMWAQDRAEGVPAPDGAERLLVMVNAPARADLRPVSEEAVAACGEAAFARLARAGFAVERGAEVVTTPRDFARMFPGTGGALYGAAVHGWQAAFSRPGARTKIPGLYLAGGSTHPGAGVAMAAMSGQLAAAAVIGDRG